jgi:SpoVK/Ycf46/Vps4 family AAA+-type ATPase
LTDPNGFRANRRYGSAYDPRNGGKIMRETAQERRAREQHQLRGCGDPGCPMCNPDTAANGAGGGSASSGGNRGMSANSLDYEMMRSIMWSRPDISGAFAEYTSSRATNAAAPKGPPASYRDARKAVDGWISSAPEQAFDDIVGNDDALAQLRDAIRAPVEHKELYDAYGMKMPKGALLSGPPGCGKTMFARAAASEMKRLYGEGVEFISISGSELQSMYVGETEGRIKAIFTFAREYKAHHGHPLLVFMDEAEVLLPDRTGRVRRVASWEESQVATFLAEMDGIHESGAFVLLATNRPEVMDQAVLRDGRCDFKITVKRPTREAIETILAKNFAGVLLGDDGADTLVFAALESLYNPHRVILECHALLAMFGADGLKVETKDRHFLLEHVVSGAMAASIPQRAIRYAFARDKANGCAKGVLAADVVAAVKDIFEENRGLDHSFALEEFRRELFADLKLEGLSA